MEEIARIYGYDRIPETRMADELPPQRSNPQPGAEERVRDLLVELGLAGSGHLPPDLARARGQPSACRVRRRMTSPTCSWPTRSPATGTCCATACSPACWKWSSATPACASAWPCSRSARSSWLREEGELPDELQRLVIVLTGPRDLPAWQPADSDADGFLTT